jgi:hypothetical protein
LNYNEEIEVKSRVWWSKSNEGFYLNKGGIDKTLRGFVDGTLK